MFSKICVFYTDFLKALYEYNGAVEIQKFYEDIEFEIKKQATKEEFKRGLYMMFSKNKKLNEKLPIQRRKSAFFDKEMSKLVLEGKS